MFVTAASRLDTSFDEATLRLAALIRGGRLGRAADDSYQAEAARVTPPGPGAGVLFKLVQVQAGELSSATDRRSARLPLRWQASGPGGRSFAVLDADITLAAAGDDACQLGLVGAFRPPPGHSGKALDAAVLHQVATDTIQDFLCRVGMAIMGTADGDAAAREP